MARNERRPRSNGAPANITNHHDPQSITRPCDELLARLDRVKKSPRGWTARCPGPNHHRGDKSASLSIAEGNDGRALLHCFAGCATEDVVRGLRLELRDLFLPRDDPARVRRRPRPKPAVLPRSVARELVESTKFCLTWEAAKLLAPLPPTLMHQDVLSAWDGLVSLGIDIPALVRLAGLIRGVGFLRYADARDVEDADIARAVNRLIDEIERRAAA